MDENSYELIDNDELLDALLEQMEKDDLVPVLVPRDALNISTLELGSPVIFDAERGLLSIKKDKEAVSLLLASQKADAIAEDVKKEEKNIA